MSPERDVESVSYRVSVKVEPGEGEGIPTYEVSFYYSESGSIIDRRFVYNRISISRKPEEEVYSVVLESRGEKDAAQLAGVFAWTIVFDWAAKKNLESLINPHIMGG